MKRKKKFKKEIITEVYKEVWFGSDGYNDYYSAIELPAIQVPEKFKEGHKFKVTIQEL